MPLVIPVIIMGGILTGWFTPTEAGVVAVVYILVVAIPLLNRGHLRELPLDFVQAGPALLDPADHGRGGLGLRLDAGLSARARSSSRTGSPASPAPTRQRSCSCWSALFVIIGDFIEPIPAIIIFMPIVNKLTEIGGINPVHMGVVIIITLAFGLITPPYGLALLMASKFVGVRFSLGAGARRCRSTSCSSWPSRSASCFPNVVLWLPEARAAGIGRLLQEPGRHRLHLPGLSGEVAPLPDFQPSRDRIAYRNRIFTIPPQDHPHPAEEGSTDGKTLRQRAA